MRSRDMGYIAVALLGYLLGFMTTRLIALRVAKKVAREIISEFMRSTVITKITGLRIFP